MLKLVSCELAKLKRKKFIPFVIVSAFMFPLPLALLMLTPRMTARYDTKAELLALIHIPEPTRQAEIAFAVLCFQKKTQYSSL